jgi:hypothetical protein
LEADVKKAEESFAALTGKENTRDKILRSKV